MSSCVGSWRCISRGLGATVLALIVSDAGAQYRPNLELYFRASPQRPLGGVDAVLPLLSDRQSLLALDLKGHLDEGDANELNLGMFWRNMDAREHWATGVYGSLDRRRTRAGSHFYQVSVGAEVRSAQWDVRANYYHPTTDKQLVGTGATQFFGFGLVRNGIYEESMRGGDIEVGFRLPHFERVESRIYFAGYTFSGKDIAGTTSGGRIRAEVRPRQDIVLGLAHQRDSMFGRATFLELRYAFGKAPKRGPRTLADRMTDPWQRDIDVAVSPRTESTNPLLGEPVPGVMVVHVDSSKPAGGDGSAERPYNDTAGCAKCADPSFNTVRLWKGNSSTSSPYTSYAMQAGQTLLGEGYDTTRNVVTGNYPVIGTAGAAITLADNSSVSGVHARSSAGVGILGRNLSGIVTVKQNLVTVNATGTEATGLRFEDTATVGGRSPNLTIVDNAIDVTGAPPVITMSGTTIYGASGISIQHRARPGGATNRMTMDIATNRVTVVTRDGAGLGITLANTGNGGVAESFGRIAGNTISVLGGLHTLSRGIENTNDFSGGTIRQTLTISGNDVRVMQSAGGPPAGLDGIRFTSGVFAPFPLPPGTHEYALEITGNKVVTDFGGITPFASSSGSGFSVIVRDNAVSRP